MTSVVASIRGEFLRYKALAEATIGQVDESDLSAKQASVANSIATICWHVSGNLDSRFTEFLTSDGEKPWREREEEFRARTVTREELLAKWGRGWDVLMQALDELSDDDLQRSVMIRRQSFTVVEALHRSLSHVSYHVGQIVYIGKSLRGEDWRYLTIPPGQSDAYNQAPGNDGAVAFAQTLADRQKSSHEPGQ
jgi:uncharacterized damage-inducible protein DinB